MRKSSEDRSKVGENYPYSPWRYDSEIRVVRQGKMRVNNSYKCGDKSS
jgi:hypothetical protein